MSGHFVSTTISLTTKGVNIILISMSYPFQVDSFILISDTQLLESIEIGEKNRLQNSKYKSRFIKALSRWLTST